MLGVYDCVDYVDYKIFLGKIYYFMVGVWSLEEVFVCVEVEWFEIYCVFVLIWIIFVL